MQASRPSLMLRSRTTWRPRLEPLRCLAPLRIVHCVVTHDGLPAGPGTRPGQPGAPGAHRPSAPDHDLADFARHRDAFDRVSLEAPRTEVDTTEGYKPGLVEIVSFVNDP